MATNPATANDLASRSLRTLSQPELQVGGTLLDDAWFVIIAQVPSVPARLDTTPFDPAFFNLIVQVECAMVLRVLNNPSGVLEKTEAVDDYSGTLRYDSTVSTGALYLTPGERDLLGLGDGVSSDAFTIRAPATPFSQEFPVWDSLL